jgi:DNA-binding transcriptional MocR family regulator
MQTTRPMQNPKAQRKLASVRLDRRLVTPLFRQVYQRIREAILDGTLPPGASLPSTRSLAGQLSTARGTIELAYALLVGEGRDAVMIEAETALAKLRAISKRSASINGSDLRSPQRLRAARNCNWVSPRRTHWGAYRYGVRLCGCDYYNGCSGISLLRELL